MGGRRGPLPRGERPRGAGRGRSWLPRQSPARGHPLPDRKLTPWPAERGAGGAHRECCLPGRLGKGEFRTGRVPRGAALFSRDRNSREEGVPPSPARSGRQVRAEGSEARHRVASPRRWGWTKGAGYLAAFPSRLLEGRRLVCASPARFMEPGMGWGSRQ